jgi:cytochrome c peroxidase
MMMAGGRKAVQQGVRVKLPSGLTWVQLAAMSPDEISEKDLFPQGFLPLPHVKHATGGMVFPTFEITEINKQEARSLERFDADFDLPDHLLPEFPPPVFLTTRPELGDVSRGQLLTIRNYFAILDGILTPVQMDGMRLLLTPFPQQQFNQTDDRKTDVQSLGVACLDCHSNGHTNAAFHQNPDNRPQVARFRIDTVSLRGMFNQRIHAEGPIKTFTLRGIKDSPPYMHDGRLLTLEDTVEFFNLVLGVQLTPRDKAALVAFMRQL